MRKDRPATSVANLAQSLYGVLLAMELIEVPDICETWIIGHDATQGDDLNRRFQYWTQVSGCANRDLPSTTVTDKRDGYAAANHIPLTTQSIEDHLGCTIIVDWAVAPVSGNSDLEEIAQVNQVAHQ